MEILTFGLIFVGGLAVGTAIWYGRNTMSHRCRPDPRVLALQKDVGNLRIDLADLHDLYERLMTSHKRLRSSAGMAKLRGMNAEAGDKPDLKSSSEAEILRSLNLRSNR